MEIITCTVRSMLFILSIINIYIFMGKHIIKNTMNLINWIIKIISIGKSITIGKNLVAIDIPRAIALSSYFFFSKK